MVFGSFVSFRKYVHEEACLFNMGIVVACNELFIRTGYGIRV